MSLHPVLNEKLNAAVAPEAALVATRRDAALTAVPGKAHAVIGMRRAGKTTFLRQLQAGWRAAEPPERVVYLSFDDDRLAELPPEQLGLLLEEYYRRFPELRARESVRWLLDEIQLVPGWERFVRRVLDTERMQVVVSGSSARMLSREVHSSLRGRGMETLIRPFSLREFLRHRGEEPRKRAREFSAHERSKVEKRFREYLAAGGFPEAQGLAVQERIDLLQGYVDTVLFRDVVERHGVAQVAALRWLVRQCLRNPAGSFSVHRLHQDLKAQGLGVAKDALHAMVGHLEDAFLLRGVALATDSERRRNSNPRKVYPVDTGLIAAFDRSGRANAGHALETAVLHELDRRKADVGYVRTRGGFEVDFHARFSDGREELIQVCADTASRETLEREWRGLEDAAKEYRRAKKRLLVLTFDQLPTASRPGVETQPAYEWLLDGPRERGRP
ncbi:MAG: ATP-binding protein [Sulfuricaulis sp.]|nr:ATP-binding protein [Sulfuricaulis sp.]